MKATIRNGDEVIELDGTPDEIARVIGEPAKEPGDMAAEPVKEKEKGLPRDLVERCFATNARCSFGACNYNYPWFGVGLPPCQYCGKFPGEQ